MSLPYTDFENEVDKIIHILQGQCSFVYLFPKIPRGCKLACARLGSGTVVLAYSQEHFGIFPKEVYYWKLGVGSQEGTHHWESFHQLVCRVYIWQVHTPPCQQCVISNSYIYSVLHMATSWGQKGKRTWKQKKRLHWKDKTKFRLKLLLWIQPRVPNSGRQCNGLKKSWF